MCSDNVVLNLASFHTGSSDNQRDVDVFLESTFLSRIETVLRDVVAVVGGVDNICVIQHLGFLEVIYQSCDKLINSLESLETATIESVIVLNHCVVELSEVFDPPCSAVWLGNIINLLSSEKREERKYPTLSGLKLAFRGTLASGNKCLCLSAGIGGVTTISWSSPSLSPGVSPR